MCQRVYLSRYKRTYSAITVHLPTLQDTGLHSCAHVCVFVCEPVVNGGGGDKEVSSIFTKHRYQADFRDRTSCHLLTHPWPTARLSQTQTHTSLIDRKLKNSCCWHITDCYEQWHNYWPRFAFSVTALFLNRSSVSGFIMWLDSQRTELTHCVCC